MTCFNSIHLFVCEKEVRSQRNALKDKCTNRNKTWFDETKKPMVKHNQPLVSRNFNEFFPHTDDNKTTFWWSESGADWRKQRERRNKKQHNEEETKQAKPQFAKRNPNRLGTGRRVDWETLTRNWWRIPSNTIMDGSHTCHRQIFALRLGRGPFPLSRHRRFSAFPFQSFIIFFARSSEFHFFYYVKSRFSVDSSSFVFPFFLLSVHYAIRLLLLSFQMERN